MTTGALPHAGGVRIRPWAEGDVEILRRGNTPEMTVHIGGPETAEQVEARHARYLRLWRTGEAHMFAIIDESPALDAPEAVGGTGWWPTRWHDQDVYETGWHVLPEAQGRGIARAAVPLAIADVRARGDRRLLTAFPSVSNAASNRLCESAGFSHGGIESFPFRGTTLTVNAWTLDLTT
ncbi:MAG: GNAT family N-acetyltransferase [Demequinaceae bacterium]|nr:GNAT family N-acetyltransferase [Demequinaceae bacterium]